MGQAFCRRSCKRKRPDDFTFSHAFLEELKMISNCAFVRDFGYRWMLACCAHYAVFIAKHLNVCVDSERELETVYEVFQRMDVSNTGQVCSFGVFMTPRFGSAFPFFSSRFRQQFEILIEIVVLSQQLSRDDFMLYRKNLYKRKQRNMIAKKDEEEVVLPMEDRLWHLFDPASKGYVTFRTFVEVTSAMSMQGPRDAKVRYGFKMLDFDNDGKLA